LQLPKLQPNPKLARYSQLVLNILHQLDECGCTINSQCRCFRHVSFPAAPRGGAAPASRRRVRLETEEITGGRRRRSRLHGGLQVSSRSCGQDQRAATMALVASTSTADMPRTSHRFPALSRVLPKHQMPPVTAGSPPSDVSVAAVVPHTPVGLGRRCGTEVTVTAESDRWLVGAAPTPCTRKPPTSPAPVCFASARHFVRRRTWHCTGEGRPPPAPCPAGAGRRDGALRTWDDGVQALLRRLPLIDPVPP